MDVSEYYGEASDDNMVPKQESRGDRGYSQPEPPTVTVTEVPSMDNDYSDSNVRMHGSSRKLSLAFAKLFHRRKSSAPNLPEIRRHSHMDTTSASSNGNVSRRGSTFEFLADATGL